MRDPLHTSSATVSSASTQFASANPRVEFRINRSRVICTPLVLAETVQAPAHRGCVPDGYSADFQVCFPYRGLFLWEVGGDVVPADANQVLFVAACETFSMHQPFQRSYAELIFTPHLATLSEIAGVSEARLACHPLFRRRSAAAPPSLQRARAEFMRAAAWGECEPLGLEESALRLLTSATHIGAPAAPVAPGTRRLIGRTKEFLEARSGNGLQLSEIAHAVGASPAYLTSTFRRVEGVSLHRYVVQLRLARALVELPHTNDLTELALTLGFSSHSHFSAAFRSAYGCTPSAFRGCSRGRPAPPAASQVLGT